MWLCGYVCYDVNCKMSHLCVYVDLCEHLHCILYKEDSEHLHCVLYKGIVNTYIVPYTKEDTIL